MIVCFPSIEDKGSASRLSGHFGSAPWFITVDAETSESRAFPNRNNVHEHGQCSPLSSIRGLNPDAVVVRGIGPGAIKKLHAANLKVFRTEAATVGEALNQFSAGSLPEVTLDEACKNHGNSC